MEASVDQARVFVELILIHIGRYTLVYKVVDEASVDQARVFAELILIHMCRYTLD